MEGEEKCLEAVRVEVPGGVLDFLSREGDGSMNDGDVLDVFLLGFQNVILSLWNKDTKDFTTVFYRGRFVKLTGVAISEAISRLYYGRLRQC